MSAFLLALNFLTTLPVYPRRVADDQEMAASLAFYPVVGLIIGGLLAGMAYLTHFLSLGLSGDVLVVVLWIILTGGLHLDGLMDTADGIFSGRERERKLEIMRDSRIGAMGAVALLTLVLLKISFLNALSYSNVIKVLVIAPALGRSMMLYAIYCYPYARQGPGLGQIFAGQAKKLHLVIALLLLMAAAYLLTGTTGLVLLALTIVAAGIITAWIARILGGQTGDTYGAVCEITEALLLVFTVLGIAVLQLT